VFTDSQPLQQPQNWGLATQDENSANMGEHEQKKMEGKKDL
jgi:hypothetical protein